jgi:hypothetical protein
MKELKSKKTGRIQVISDEDYAAIVNKGVIDIKKFIVSDLKLKNIVPTLKEPPKEIKKKKA